MTDVGQGLYYNQICSFLVTKVIFFDKLHKTAYALKNSATLLTKWFKTLKLLT